MQSEKSKTDRYPGSVDKYPEKDKYIPEAMRAADKKFHRGTWEWSLLFLKTMDVLLAKAGLRVL